jgi:prophage maintenance system killer protein
MRAWSKSLINEGQVKYVGIDYPDWDFYIETHEIMLDLFGGHRSILRTGKGNFERIMEEVKAIEGDIYLKAATMLYKLRKIRIVEDAQKRTAFTMTSAFLEDNGGRVYETDFPKIARFVKDILKYDVEDVYMWLKNGEIPHGS